MNNEILYQYLADVVPVLRFMCGVVGLITSGIVLVLVGTFDEETNKKKIAVFCVLLLVCVVTSCLAIFLPSSEVILKMGGLK